MRLTHQQVGCDPWDESFDQLRRYLSDPTRGAPAIADSCYRRLLAALSSPEAGSADIAVLVRQALRREHERRRMEARSDVAPPQFLVPSPFPHPCWPSPSLWREAGISSTPDRPGYAAIRAVPWMPDWLDVQPREDATSAALVGIVRRALHPIEGDPFLSRAGRATYLCSGQQDAVRAVMCAPRGATLLVNLPTGAGKSLCAHLPATLNPEELSVVVVPTTALCIDQDKAIRDRIGHATAFYSGNPENEAILSRVHGGTQRIVFTSPESMGSAFGVAASAAAAVGRLRWLVIDEAHIVDQWGDEFRPAFQELAGLRLAMLEGCPNPALRFSTLLASATVTASSYDTLAALFGSPGPFASVSAVQLRPEPSYYFSFCHGDAWQAEDVKRRRVLESIRHLPRPSILYTTVVPDADRWYADLRAAGFRRIDRVTGKTPADERERVLARWRAGMTDLVVATSAFGLGVDQPEVRAIIHACVPENLDRFYQEVGRGGRDGRGCVSLTIYTEADIEAARGINRRKIITVDLGLERWRAMFRAARPVGVDRFAVPLSAARAFGMDSRANEAWNARTLTLMARSGILDLDAEPPRPATNNAAPLRGDDTDDLRWRVVRVREHGHTARGVWDAMVEPERLRTTKRDQRNMKLMRHALRGKRCLGDVLAEMYALPGVRVAHACGGCPFCRRVGNDPSVEPMPPAPPVWQVPPLSGELASLFGGSSILAVTYGRGLWHDWRNGLGPLVDWLIEQDARLVVAPKEIRARLHDHLATRQTMVFLEDLAAFRPLWVPRVVGLILHPPDQPVPQGWYQPDAGTAPRVVVLPADARDPEKPERELISMLPRRIDAEELKVRLGL